MRTHLNPITIAAALAISAMAVGGTAFAATHHATRGHEHYSEACSALASQWSNVTGTHHSRHMKSARRQEEIGARDCHSKHTATLKAGTEHYRTALRLIGVKPHA